MNLSRELTDRSLAADAELHGIDRERFHLDLSEVIDEASKIASLPDVASEVTASDMLTTLAASIAHLTSHWGRLVRDTGSSVVYAELLKTSPSVNEDDLSRWQRLWRHR